MDGILEWRNTFENTDVGHGFLRPAPVDAVACAGEVDRRRLVAWGNRAVATGLPRMADGSPLPTPPQPRLLVATAKRPAFNDVERRHLVKALRSLRDELNRTGIETIWRLTDGLDAELDVTGDLRPLRDSLREASAVLTTPSSLMVEAMMAGRPTGLLHAQPTPLWQSAMAVWRPWRQGGETEVQRVLASLLNPAPDWSGRQDAILRQLHASDPSPMEALANLILDLANQPRTTVRLPDWPRVLKPTTPPRSAGSRRIVSLVSCEGSPIGGVTSWSIRLSDALERLRAGYEWHTILIGTQEDACDPARVLDAPDGRTHRLLVDPTLDPHALVQAVRETVDRFEPDIVFPNYADFCGSVAAQLRFTGVRAIATAHTDDVYYRDQIATFGPWDGAVAVSAACRSWLESIVTDVPIRTIVYGVPSSPAPRASDTADAPLRLAYVGRVVQLQKRVFDLLHVIDGLERRRVSFELHVVGDGPDLSAWRRALAERSLRHGRVVMHGRRSPGWIQRFWPRVDATVLVSEFEGTSITMLEAMGQGVVPVVTAVASGVDEWVRDGENGIVVPIGRPDAMAERLADLARDRRRMETLGRAAWETVRNRLSLERMAEQYVELFNAVLARPMHTPPTDAVLRLTDPWRWPHRRAEDPAGARRWAIQRLREAGFKRVLDVDAAVTMDLGPDDAVVFDVEGTLVDAERLAQWRASGTGVALTPLPFEPVTAMRLDRAVRDAVAAGARRIAIYGTGRHTRRAAPAFSQGHPIVGFIDDSASPPATVYGLPVVRLDEASERLAMDAIVLSSDAWEARMWERTLVLRRRGVRVMPLYGQYDDATEAPREPMAVASG